MDEHQTQEPGTEAASGMAAGGGRPLRVLLIANTLPPTDVSGVGEQVLQLAAGLRGAGCRVEVLGRGGGGEGALPGARGPKVLFPLSVVPAAWRALRRWRPDVVQVHESDGALAALLVRLWRRWPGRRTASPGSAATPLLVALLQVSYRRERRAVRPLVAPDGRVLGRPGAVERRFRTGKAWLQIVLGTLTARLADRVLTPSAVTAGEVEADYGVRGVAVVPNVTGGLPVAAAVDGGEEGGGVNGSGVAGDGALLFVGRLRIRKGVEVLLEALAGLAAAGRPARLLVAGDGEHRAALERRAAELGLGAAVTFLGRCGAGRVRALLAAARALVVPSTYEGMPLVVLEAMEAGVPVVASAVSGIPEVVVDGETGWLVPAEDPRALAAALGEVLDDAAQAVRRGAAGRRRLDERYRPAHGAERWLAAVAPLLPPSARAPREG
jgi:glycosyltransferase involved in cell wall biosynthesis